jgi:hypothetical protein
MPVGGDSLARALIKKVEKAKRTPAIRPQPKAVDSLRAKNKELLVSIKSPAVNPKRALVQRF